MTLNKGTSSASTLDFQPGGAITVQGANTSGFLTIANGTFVISGTGALTNPVFATAAYTIPATGAFWLNDGNATVVGQSGNPTNNGLLRVSDGTFNVGTNGTHVMGAGAGAAFNVEGGTTNFAGRLASSNAFITYRQSGGSVNVCVAGGCATAPSFGFTGATGVVTKLSGGSINLVQANTAATPVDYNEAGTMVYTGGTLNVGTAATATNFVFRVQGQTPNVVLDNTTSNKTLNLSGQLNVWGNLTINPGTTVNVNPGTAQTLLQIGPTITNNGAIVTNTTNTGTVNLAGSLQALGGGYAQTYAGTGTFGTPTVRLGTLSVQSAAGVTLDPSVSALNVNRVNAFYGAIGNSDRISVGAGDATVLVIQRGATGIAFAAGSFAQTPTYNIGSGGLIEVYSQSQAPLTTGPEIPGTQDRARDADHQPDGRHDHRRRHHVDRNRDRLGRAPAQLGHAHDELLEPSAPDGRGGRRRLRRIRGQLRQRSAVPHASGEPDRSEHLRVPGREGLVQELRAHQHGDGRGRHGHDRGGSVRHRLRRDGRRRLRRPEPQPLLVGADHGRRGQLHEHDRPRDRAGDDLGERDRPVGDRRRHLRLDRRRRPATDDWPEHPDHVARLLRGRPRNRRSDDQRHPHGRSRRRLRHADRCSGCAEQPRPDRPGHLPVDRSDVSGARPSRSPSTRTPATARRTR